MLGTNLTAEGEKGSTLLGKEVAEKMLIVSLVHLEFGASLLPKCTSAQELCCDHNLQGRQVCEGRRVLTKRLQKLTQKSNPLESLEGKRWAFVYSCLHTRGHYV